MSARHTRTHIMGTAPGVTDDSSTLKVAVGDLWINTATDDVYILTDGTVGAAVWKQLDNA